MQAIIKKKAPIKVIVSIICLIFISACTSNTEPKNNGHYGKWTLLKVVYEDGDFKDLSKETGHFIKIGKTEVSEIMAEYGVRSYPYTQKGNVLNVAYVGGDDTWTIVKSSEHTMEIDTPIGRYILSR